MRRPFPRSFLLFAGLAACSGAQDGVSTNTPPPCPTAAASDPAKASADKDPVTAPASVAAAEGAVKTLASRDDVPLTGPRVDGKAGDWMVDNGLARVVVTTEGRIVDYGVPGARDELVWLNPSVSVGLSALDSPVKAIRAEGRALRVERDVGGKPLRMVSWVYLTGTLLHVDTVTYNTGDDTALAVTLGERVSWGNVPTWMDGQGYVKAAGKLTGQFLARDALGTAYALCSNDGPLYARFDDQEYGGFFEPARTGESVVLVPAHGQSAMRSIVLSTSTRSLGEAIMALPCKAAQASAEKVKLEIPSLPGVNRLKMEVARCEAGNKGKKPFAEFRGAPGPDPKSPSATIGTIELPKGCFRARLSAPGRVSTPWMEPEKLAASATGDLLPAGTLALVATENGKPLPARLVARGEGNTPDPDWWDDADGSGAASNVLATADGSAQVTLPPGKYRVLVNRGFEYTAHEEKIEIKAGKTTTVKAALSRVVDTKGWVSADMHLHSVPSSDAPSLLTDRVRSLVAAGVEVAVATDHNAVTDYRPAIAELGVQDRILSIIGDEITTRDVPFGHFNAFPLAPETAPFAYKGTLPSAIFSAVHAAKPYGKDTILQVNHPRMGGIGYFELLRFDPEDIPGWLKRSPLADMGFDALEVFNGDHYTRIGKVEEILKDWYALLNAGYRYTATGNSDSHRVSFHEAGVPRSLVMMPTDDPSKVDERAFVEAVRAGKVVVSSGPFVTLRVGDKTVGDTIAEGQSEISVSVDAPPWVDVEEVMLVKRGETLKAWKTDKAKGKRPWQFKTTEPLKKGDWVIAIARGSKPMTYLYRPGATPFAFTNPIFVK